MNAPFHCVTIGSLRTQIPPPVEVEAWSRHASEDGRLCAVGGGGGESLHRRWEFRQQQEQTNSHGI